MIGSFLAHPLLGWRLAGCLFVGHQAAQRPPSSADELFHHSIAGFQNTQGLTQEPNHVQEYIPFNYLHPANSPEVPDLYALGPAYIPHFVSHSWTSDNPQNSLDGSHDYEGKAFWPNVDRYETGSPFEPLGGTSSAHPRQDEHVFETKEIRAHEPSNQHNDPIFDGLEDLMAIDTLDQSKNFASAKDLSHEPASASPMSSFVHLSKHHGNNPSESVAKHAPLKKGDIDFEIQTSKEFWNSVKQYLQDNITSKEFQEAMELTTLDIHPHLNEVPSQDSKGLKDAVLPQAASRESRKATLQGLDHHSDAVGAASQATKEMLIPSGNEICFTALCQLTKANTKSDSTLSNFYEHSITSAGALHDLWQVQGNAFRFRNPILKKGPDLRQPGNVPNVLEPESDKTIESHGTNAQTAVGEALDVPPGSSSDILQNLPAHPRENLMHPKLQDDPVGTRSDSQNMDSQGLKGVASPDIPKTKRRKMRFLNQISDPSKPSAQSTSASVDVSDSSGRGLDPENFFGLRPGDAVAPHFSDDIILPKWAEPFPSDAIRHAIDRNLYRFWQNHAPKIEKLIQRRANKLFYTFWKAHEIAAKWELGVRSPPEEDLALQMRNLNSFASLQIAKDELPPIQKRQISGFNYLAGLLLHESVNVERLIRIPKRKKPAALRAEINSAGLQLEESVNVEKLRRIPENNLAALRAEMDIHKRLKEWLVYSPSDGDVDRMPREVYNSWLQERDPDFFSQLDQNKKLDDLATHMRTYMQAPRRILRQSRNTRLTRFQPLSRFMSRSPKGG